MKVILQISAGWMLTGKPGMSSQLRLPVPAVGAKGDQQQQEQGVEEKQQLPVLRQPLQVHGGQQDIEQDTQSRSRQLHREAQMEDSHRISQLHLIIGNLFYSSNHIAELPHT